MRALFRQTLFTMLCVLAIAVYGCGQQDTGDAHDHDHADETPGAVAAVHDDHDVQGHETEADHDGHEENGEDDHAEAGGDIHDHEDESGFEAGSDWEDMIHLETAAASVMPMKMALTVPGTIIPDQNRVAVVSPFIESSVNRVFVNVGDRVTENTELACLASPEIGMMRADYNKAQAELEIKKQVYARQERLFKEDIVPRRVFEEAELDLHVANVDYEYARKKLMAVGLRENEFEGAGSCRDGVEGASIHVHAPISGVITKRSTQLGEMVDASNELFEIMDLRKVWLEADIFEKDLAKIHIGQNVLVKVSAFDDHFSGKIFYIGSTLDEVTKTIKVLVEIDNKSERLKPGMYASTDIIIGEKEDALVIPESAVLDDENLKVVFVREESGYHRHVVTTGIQSAGMIEVVEGLEPGDIVVTTGNFQLKSRLKMSTVDPHAGHNH